MQQWFTFQNEKVSGPYSTDQLRSLIASGSLSTHFVWGAVLDQWVQTSQWLANVNDFEKRSRKQAETQMWHYALHGDSFGPFTKLELIQQLKMQKRISDVSVWTKGMKSWTPIFEQYELLDAIGVNRRQFPRTSIDGRVVVKWEEQTAIGTLQVVGEGGMGAAALPMLAPGQFVSVELQSKAFHEPIYAKAEVRSVDTDGVVGFRFVQISAESRSSIVQYVRKHMNTPAAQAA